MGLFGYNEKDYKKNTDLFKSKMADIAEYSNQETRRLLNTIERILDESAFKGDKKKMEDIDKNINIVLDKMLNDAHSHKTGSVFEQAQQLYDLVERNRRHCEITYTKESLERRDKMASILGGMVDLLQQQEQMHNRQEAILEEARDYPEGSAKREKLRNDYNVLDIQIKKIEQTVFEYQKRYNTAARALAAVEQGASITFLSEQTVITPKEMDKVLADTAAKLDQIHGMDDEITSSLDTFDSDQMSYAQGVATTDSFSEAMTYKEQQQMGSSINGANAPSRNADPFSTAMNKKN